MEIKIKDIIDEYKRLKSITFKASSDWSYDEVKWDKFLNTKVIIKKKGE